MKRRGPRRSLAAVTRHRAVSLRRKLFAVGALAALFCTPAFGDSAGVRNDSSLGSASGEQVYTEICQGCHMPHGQGAIGAGHYPAFAHDPVIASAPYMALTILGGRRGMPAFGPTSAADSGAESFIAPTTLTDAQVAGVINYIRTHFGNAYKDSITTAEVRALHP